MLTLGSLFDGIGGWQLAAQHAGVKPIWSSEIDEYPAEVTKIRFPKTKQLGDITKLDGANLPCVDIICAGSPCQDLSIAGKREGLNGERSGLFRKAVDIVHGMRKSTGGRYPQFFVWENVTGALTSNKGADFRTVLEKIGQESIPMPDNGKWAKAGMVQFHNCQVAWRVLDAQYWGVPQRRNRIFLVADFTGKRAGKILFVEPSLSRNFETGGKAREEITRDIRKSIKKSNNRVVSIGHDERAAGFQPDIADPLTANDYKTPPTVAYGFYPQLKAESVTFTHDKSTCLINGTNAGYQNGVCICQKKK